MMVWAGVDVGGVDVGAAGYDRAMEACARVDVLIVGGGVAGLWALDALVRAGYDAILIERDGLGAGQTGWSQGILHSGVKYALSGLMNESAAAVSALPERWQACWSGDGEVDLSGVSLRSRWCWMWRTQSLRSKVGMLGAKLALRTKPEAVDDAGRPGVLRDCPGEVAKLGEWVIEPRSLVERLALKHAGRVFKGEVRHAARQADGSWAVTLASGETACVVRASAAVLAAGGGNAALRSLFSLTSEAQQIRALRMLVVKGPLPELNGHCVDGAATRVTITSAAADQDGRRVWQVGGQVAERGPAMEPSEHLAWGISELRAAIPGLSLAGCVVGAYDAPRAEGAMGGRRPDDAVVQREGSVVTVWPTKLVLGPRASDLVCDAVRAMGGDGACRERTEPLAATALAERFERAKASRYVWERDGFVWQAIG